MYITLDRSLIVYGSIQKYNVIAALPLAPLKRLDISNKIILPQEDTTYDSCPAYTRPLLQSSFRLRLNSRLYQRNCHSSHLSSPETR